MTTTIIRAAADTASTSQHIGNIGDLVDIQGATVLLLSGMTVVEDSDGNQFEVRSRRSIASGKRVLVHIVGEVIGHKEFRGVKRTVIDLRRELRVLDNHPMLAK